MMMAAVDRGEKSMKRIFAVFAMTLAILVSAYPAHAQPAGPAGKVYRIGYLTAGSAKAFKQRLAAFRQGLKALGYVEGKNIVLEERYAAGRRKRLPAMAAELVGLDVDVLITHGGTSTRLADRAVKAAGRPIPIVFATLADPVGNGTVASLARPGGNITGLSNATSLLVPKRLAILKEAVPSVTRVAVLWSPLTRNGAPQLKALEAIAPKLGVTILPVVFAKPDDFDRAFAEIRTARPDALNVLGWSLINAFRKRIAARALENNLPTIYSNPRHISAGGLMAYGVDLLDMYRRAATYVDKILKGANPAEMPVELPTKFEFVINLKTAKALGITFPPSILLRADRVIE